MYIYSGECRLCEVGLKTNLIDDVGNALYTGDIVVAYTITKDTGIVGFYNLTAVVANHYDNFCGLPPVECIDANKSDAFVMGIKNSDIREPLEDYPDTVWRVKKLKSYTDVIEGEHWKEWGFHYSKD
jgi:hypothetical protein